MSDRLKTLLTHAPVAAGLALLVGCGGDSSAITEPEDGSSGAKPVSYEAIAGDWLGECTTDRCQQVRGWWVSINLDERAKPGERIGTVAYGWDMDDLADVACNGELRARSANPPTYIVKEMITFVVEGDNCPNGTITLEYDSPSETLSYVWEHPDWNTTTASLNRTD